MLLQSVFDPGHGPLSSFDEQAVAVVAFVVLATVGVLVEHHGESRGLAVVGALLAFVVGLVLIAPPPFAAEWHYAVVAAVPVVLGNYLYRGRRRRRAGMRRD
jgi:fucose permease